MNNIKNTHRRKFQVSNGYLLEFDQLARVLNFLSENGTAKRITREELQSDTGLAKRQIGSIVSIGAAMGLIIPGRQILTQTGHLIAKHDIFVEKKSTLEWCHYFSSSSYNNLIWYEIFNKLLYANSPMTQEEWKEDFRKRLAGQYTERTIGKHLNEEVRFIIDAYLERNFRELELLLRGTDGTLYRKRYTNFNSLILSAMIYNFCEKSEIHMFQVSEIVLQPGSPAVVFGLDESTFRQLIESLHDHGWLRFETTHNLDQVRLKPGFSALEFLTAHFEDREPQENSKPAPGDLFE